MQGNKDIGGKIAEMFKTQEDQESAKNLSSEKLQALFEGCLEKTVSAKMILDKTVEGDYKSKLVGEFFDLWISGFNQGVATHAATRGDILL